MNENNVEDNVTTTTQNPNTAFKVTVLRGGVEVCSFPNSNFMSIQGMYDGFVINLKNNIFITISDPYIPQEVKELISFNVPTFIRAGNITIELLNTKNPISVISA